MCLLRSDTVSLVANEIADVLSVEVIVGAKFCSVCAGSRFAISKKSFRGQVTGFPKGDSAMYSASLWNSMLICIVC